MKKNLPRIFAPHFLAPMALLALLGSCAPAAVVEQLAGSKDTPREAITSIAPPAENGEGSAADAASAAGGPSPAARGQLVLERGNLWAAGIPGFGENALAAFTGEYRVPGTDSPMRIWLTREFLYYDGWASRASITSALVRQKAETVGRIAAVALDGGVWTMVLLLPRGNDLDQEEEDRLITLFMGRFAGFSPQTDNISLPAIIPL